MAWALRVCTTIFSRRAPGPATRLTSSTHLGPCRVPTSWSWTTTAGDRVLGTSPLSSTACNAHPPRATDADARGGRQTLAIKAVVGVVVESCDGEPPPHDVYGSVTATTSTTTPSTASPPLTLSHSLFDRAKGDQVRVPEGAAMPLLLTERFVVSAPLRSGLTVSASLRGVNNAYYFGDHEIAEGSVVFATRLDGNDTAVISGNHGMVRVDVTWSSILA